VILGRIQGGVIQLNVLNSSINGIKNITRTNTEISKIGMIIKFLFIGIFFSNIINIDFD